MKRVLFITHYPGVGGANLSMVYLINILKRNYRIEPMVFIPKNGPVSDLLDKFGIPYEVHRYASWRIADRGVFNILMSVAMVMLNVFQAIRFRQRVARNFDLLYCNSSKVVFGSFLKYLCKKPLVWHLREFGTIDYPMTFLLPRRIVSRVFKSADVCVCISKEVEKVYRTMFSPNANYKLVYNGIVVDNYRPRNKKQASNTLRICMAGGFDPSKNQEDLILAIAKLSARERVHIDFFGDHDTPYGRQMAELVRKFDLENNITFKGQTKGLNDIMPLYDVGVITSKYEAFGRVIIECMLSGLAVVVPNAGACPELVKDGITGMIYKLGDSDDLADKIQYLLDNPEEMNAMAENGKNMARKSFSAQSNAHKIAEIFDSVIL